MGKQVAVVLYVVAMVAVRPIQSLPSNRCGNVARTTTGIQIVVFAHRDEY
jgi:hypothetical protein